VEEATAVPVIQVPAEDCTTPGERVNETEAFEAMFLQNMTTTGEIEKDPGIAIETLDELLKLPHGIVISPKKLREYQTWEVRQEKKANYTSNKKRRDLAIARGNGGQQQYGMKMLEDFGGLGAVRAKFPDFGQVGQQIQKLVKETVFKEHKLPMCDSKEQCIVLRMAKSGDLKWSNSRASGIEVALLFHKEVGRKIGLLQTLSVQNARKKFMGKSTYCYGNDRDSNNDS